MSKLSEFNNNIEVDDYAKYRNIIGLDILKKYVKNINNDDTHVVIDLGCGCGHYLKELDDEFSNMQLVGIDRSIEMLLNANRRFNSDFSDLVPDPMSITDKGNSLSLLPREIGDKLPIPFMGDVILSYQTLHYLEGESGAVRLLTDASKFSKIGSHFIINLTTPEQIISFWYLQHLPNLINKLNTMTLPVCRLVYIANAFGWELVESKNHNGPNETLQNPDKYKDINSILENSFLNSNPVMSLAEFSDIEKLINYVKDLKPDQASEMFNMLDSHRQVFGQSTTLVFKRVKNIDTLKNILIKQD